VYGHRNQELNQDSLQDNDQSDETEAGADESEDEDIQLPVQRGSDNQLVEIDFVSCEKKKKKKFKIKPFLRKIGCRFESAVTATKGRLTALAYTFVSSLRYSFFE
jgi:hypothetical protein